MRQTQSQGTTDQVIGTSPCGQEIATTSAMAGPDGAFLQKFGNRLREKVGVLLTPPVGAVAHELRQVQSYVDELVRDMGPRSIKGSVPSTRLVVNLYSSDIANAFVARLDEQNGRPMPDQAEIRQHFDPENGRRPIYEIGVTLGLLRSVSSEEELRYVLAHELAHFTENHIERNSSLGSQTHEAVADAIAFKTVASCGKNPVGGLHCLQRNFEQLGPEQHKSVIESSLSAGHGSHHHEGVRIAFAQAKIRQIEFENPALLSLELTPVPDFVRLTINPRQTNPEAWARGLETGRKFADGSIQAAISGTPADLWIGQIRPSDIPDVLVQGLERIRNEEGATSTQKLDAIVGFIELLAESQGEASLVLSLDAQSELTRTIAGLLRDGGTFEQVIERVKQPIDQKSADRWESLLEPALLKSLGALVNRHPEVISLYKDLPKTVAQVRRHADRDLSETMALIVKVSTLNRGVENPIVERLQGGALESLEACLAATENLPLEGMRCLYLLERLHDQSSFERAVRGVVIDFAARSREKLLTMLEGALADSGDFDREWTINQGLSSLGRLFRYQPLTESDELRLGTALLDFFSQDGDRGDFETITVKLGENPELLGFLTSLAHSPLADDGQKKAIRDCIFSNLPATNLPRRGTVGDLVDELTSIVNSTLDGEGIRYLAGQVRSPRISEEHHFHRLATPIAVLARSGEGSQRIAQEFNFNQTSHLIDELSIRIRPVRAGIQRKKDRRGGSSGVSLPLKLSGEAPRFLLDCVVASQAQAPNLEIWHKTLSSGP